MECLLWSGGLDSTLLLVLMIEQGKVFDIVQFRENWTLAQKKKVDALIREHNLKVFDYAPRGFNLVGQGKDISLIFEYAFGTGAIPVVRDVIEGTTCITDIAPKRMDSSPFQWTRAYIGSRKDDTHPMIGQPVKSERFEVGGVEFIAPLYNWTREQVVNALKARGFDTETTEQTDTGNLSCCTLCLNGTGKVKCPKDGEIDSIVWDREENLRVMRDYYGF